jgi:rhodanese-related sulfurtransferase
VPLTVEDLAVQIAAGTQPRIIDIREPYEWRICHLVGAEHLPLSDIQTWWPGLDRDESIVFYCHHGRRSAAVCSALAAEGFRHLYNLEGGIDAWSSVVDPGLPRY